MQNNRSMCRPTGSEAWSKAQRAAGPREEDVESSVQQAAEFRSSTRRGRVAVLRQWEVLEQRAMTESASPLLCRG